MGAIPGAGDGMRADTAGISGRGAGNDGRAVVPAGVPVRVRGHGGRDIRAGTGGERDHGRGEAFGDWVRALPEGRGRVWHGDEGWRRGRVRQEGGGGTEWDSVGAGRGRVGVDGAGGGSPVVDLLRDARPGCVVMAVNITSGLKETSDGGYYGVPKRDLIVGLQVLLQRGVLRIAAGLPEGEELVKELAGMQVRISPSGNEQMAAWREGTHDDLGVA